MIWESIIKKWFIFTLLHMLLFLTGCTFYDGDAMDGYMGSDDPCFLTVRNDSGTDTPYVYISNDGKHWNQVSVVPLAEVQVLAYGEGLFVAGGKPAGTSGDLIAYSPDGINWDTTITWNGPETPVNNDFIRAMDYNNGTFICSFYDISVTVPPKDKFYYSHNGIEWHAGNGASSQTPYSMRYGGGIFVLLAIFDLQVSSDGINWSGDIWDSTSIRLCSVAYGNTLFVVGGDDTSSSSAFLALSDDGYTYTNNLLLDNNVDLIIDIFYGNRKFVALSQDGYTYVSDNGFIWDGPSQIKDAVGETMLRIVYGNNLFVTVSHDGIYYSEDGIHWSGNVAPAGPGLFIDIVYRP
ncbi:MAG: hypothetical protein ACOCWZ_02555 [Spirochaetota bacterium]